jgi:integrase
MGLKVITDSTGTVTGYRIDFRDRSGRRHRTTFRRQKDAERALRRALDAVEDGSFIGPRQIPTFRDAAEQWFQGKLAKRPASVMFWRGHLDRHLLPHLGPLRLSYITVETIEALRDRLLIDSPLSPTSVKKVLTTASAVFKAAIKKGRATMNPAALADRPEDGDREIGADGEVYRVGRSRAVTAEDVLSPEEIQRLLANATAGYYRALLWVAAATGARHSEVLALQWSDIDFVEGVIRIERTLSWARRPGEPMRARFLPPKTRAGRRTVPACPELLHQLEAWRVQSAHFRPGDLVFPNSSGNPQQRKTVLEEGLRPALTAAELRRVTMHSLRHSFASALIAAGAPIPEVQAYLGHATATVTLDTYAHFLPRQRTDAVANLSRQFVAAGEVQSGDA